MLIDIAVPGLGGMAVSRPDPIMFNDAIRTTHVENSGPDVSITLLSVKKLLVSSVHKFSE